MGIFDSGLGGLTAMRELSALLPAEDLIYLGDTARVPYGTRSAATVVRFALQDAQFLLRRGVKLLVVACGTVSSVALEALQAHSPVPVIGIVEPVARAAAAATRNGRVAILGTNATIRSGAIARELVRLDSRLKVTGLSCPLLVPLVENGYVKADQPLLREALREYLPSVVSAGADVAILGCTHFPVVSSAIREMLPAVTLVDSGREVALATVLKLREQALENLPENRGRREYFITDEVANFQSQAERFLGHSLEGGVQKVELAPLDIRV